VQQPLPLSVVEVAGQFDVPINMIDPSAAGFALDAVFGVNARLPQRHSNSLVWPSLRAAYFRTVIEVHAPSAANSGS
jgi:hypothetical protein